jgi:hypothetical protein
MAIRIIAAILLCATIARAQLTREQVIAETMRPYAGPHEKGVDASTLSGKVMCGYQGWFACEGDGAGRGWYHWTMGGEFSPGHCKIDLWPDVSELDRDERYPTAFKLANGKPAEVYSAFNKKIVLRHFKWMKDYGIDGVFVQRFAAEMFDPRGLRQFTTVLGNCREGANRFGRTYAVMYDLSGMQAGQMPQLMDDWRALVDRMKIRDDKSYLHHNGKPVVAVWGFGFNDGRKYTLDESIELIRFLKNDKKYGGNTVMLGVPYYWREMKNDSVNDPKFHDLIKEGDIVSPWAVGRYRTTEQSTHIIENVVPKDIAWCKENGKEFLPVVFPGFSWHNMKPADKLDAIPRLGGKFLWNQYAEMKRAGATMVYQAMFDEVDEGTAIFKVTNDPPVGESKFVTYEGLPSDFYLKLVGKASLMVRGEIEVSDAPPAEK